MTRFRTASCAALAFGLLLAGCAKGPKVEAGGEAPPQHEAGWTARKAVGEAIELLNKGDAAGARAKLIDVLKSAPNDPVARSLVRQIDDDPVALLGKQNFAYTAKEGDTYSTVAGRFLGNPILFYGLARYNGATAAGAIPAGTALKIPGKEKPAPKPKDKPKAEVPAKKPAEPAAAPLPPSAPPPAPKKPAAPGAAQVGAQVQKLRAQALEQMNRGAIDRAVALLQQAARLDPANPLVKRDLDRAIRIRGAVQAH